jgi:magnesium transporter
MTDDETLIIIEDLDFDDMIDVLEELPANIVDKIVENAPKHERGRINTFLNYPEDSAGSLMTPDYISLKKDMTVKEAMDYIKNVGMDSETVYTCYVKDKGRKLIGIVSLRTLVVSDDDKLISDLMREDFVLVNVDDDQEEISADFTKYGFLAMPVVDKEKRLVGIITIDDILKVVEEEYTEDFERMGGVIDSSDDKYFDISVWKNVKNRLPWLIVLMISAVLAGMVIKHYQLMLADAIVLMAYLPLLMGTGGNSGSQASTLIIRGMATGDIQLKNALKVLWKEFRVSLALGIFLSIINFGRILLIEREGMAVAIAVSVSMLIVIILAKSLGGLLPMLAKKVGIDPALMAAPMITSLIDIFSCIIYFTVASFMFSL